MPHPIGAMMDTIRGESLTLFDRREILLFYSSIKLCFLNITIALWVFVVEGTIRYVSELPNSYSSISAGAALCK